MKSYWCMSTPLYWHYWCSMRFWPLTILFLNRLARQLTFAGTWVKRATYYVLYKNLHKHCSLIYCPYVKQFAVIQLKGLDSKIKFIYSEKAIKFREISTVHLTGLHGTNLWWRFCKILWPSQNTWTLQVRSLDLRGFHFNFRGVFTPHINQVNQGMPVRVYSPH